MMKKVLSILVVLMLLISLAACGNGEDSAADVKSDKTDEKQNTDEGGSNEEQGSEEQGSEEVQFEDTGDGKIVVWSWMQDAEIKFLDTYKAVNPDFEYEYVYVESADYLTKLTSSLASGLDMPDIIWMDVKNRATIFDMDILENFTSAPYNFDTNIMLDWTTVQNTDVDGGVKGINWDIAPGGVIVNKRLADKYLGTSDVDELEAMMSTWEDVSKLDLKGEVAAFDSLDEVTSVAWAQNVEKLYDGDMLDITSIYSATYDVAFAIHNAGLTNGNRSGDQNWYGSFATESKLITQGPIWMVPVVGLLTDGDAHLDNYVVLDAPDGNFISGGTSMGIYNGSKNKKVAWDYLQWFLLSKEGAKVNKEHNIFISLKSAYEDPAYTEMFNKNTGEQNIGEKLSEIATEVPELKLNIYTNKHGGIRTEINLKIETGEITSVEEAVEPL